MKTVVTAILLAIVSVNTVLAQTTQEPTLRETLSWIRDKCLSYSSEKTLNYIGDYTIGKPSDIIIDEAGRTLTFVYAMKDWDNHDMTYWYRIYFSSMNGNTITWSQNYSTIYLNISSGSGSACSWGFYHDGSGEGKKATMTLSFAKGTFEGEANLQARMTKAFKRAIQLSGGRVEEEKY